MKTPHSPPLRQKTTHTSMNYTMETCLWQYRLSKSINPFMAQPHESGARAHVKIVRNDPNKHTNMCTWLITITRDLHMANLYSAWLNNGDGHGRRIASKTRATKPIGPFVRSPNILYLVYTLSWSRRQCIFFEEKHVEPQKHRETAEWGKSLTSTLEFGSFRVSVLGLDFICFCKLKTWASIMNVLEMIHIRHYEY